MSDFPVTIENVEDVFWDTVYMYRPSLAYTALTTALGIKH